MEFSNKTVVVTGGTRGIGAAIGRSFAEKGANVVLTGRNLSQLRAEQSIAGSSVVYKQLELTSQRSIDEFIDYLSTIEKIDAFVNNAGINIINPIDQVQIPDFERIMSVNLKAPFVMCQALSKLMKEEGGRIVNVASIWSVISRIGRSAYITSKAGLDGLTRGLATDLAQYNILVNTVSPGFVLTQLTSDSLSKEEMYELEKTIPLGRMADPSEIARLVVFLCSEDNTYITGQNIVIDGGFTNV